MKGPGTTVLNSVFVHMQYLLTVFSSNQDAKQDMHIQEQSELQRSKHTQCQMQVHRLEINS